MKNLYITVFFLVLSLALHAQYGTGIGTETPDNSAELHVNSPGSNTGVILSVMKESEMTAIVSPATGLLVYNKTRGKFMYYTGANWAVVGELIILSGIEIENLLNPPAGMLVYNTNTNSVWYYDSTQWQELDIL